MNEMTMKVIKKGKLWTSIWALLLTSGCSNSLLPSLQSVSPSGTPSPSTSTTGNSASSDTIVISTVDFSSSKSTTGTSASVSVPPTQIFFSTTKSSGPISSHCNTVTSNNQQNGKPCFCQFSWTEINPNGGNNSAVPRRVQTPLTTVQPNFVICSAPDVFNSEILDGTQIKITILGGPGNPDKDAFNVPTFNKEKQSVIVSGSFQDAQGHIFDNVMHYSCYQKFKRGMSIQNVIKTQPNSQSGEVANYIIGSQFCIAKASGGTAQTDSCPNLPGPDYSAQANYFNFYIRNSERGDINQFNDSYICPMVKEALNSNGSIGTANQPWPMDSTFALSLSPTTVFTVGVQSNSKLAIGTEATIQSSSCFSASGTNSTSSSSGGSTNSSSVVLSCLGFAAKPNSDGTCPSFADSSGQLRSTFRLRRYIALYPKLFDTDGKAMSQTQGLDTIYVLDRPVKSPANQDPLRPFTMLGPKPCPFAYFDQKGVASIDLTVASPIPTPSPAYVSTTHPGWANKNVDGIEFPNFDNNGNGQQSCSASFPILDEGKSYFTIATVNIKNSTSKGLRHVYVRPVQPFLPHYEEDQDFQACAPQASPLQDPPLHFSRDLSSGRVAWCAESYPSQNPNVSSLDPAVTPTSAPKIPVGNIIPFTSHTKKNSESQTCTSSAISPLVTTNYKYDQSNGNKYALHKGTSSWDTVTADQTCDRTVTTQGLSWPRFPLLAPAIDIEQAINTDSSYMCMITYDNQGTKSGKTTPSDGCCSPSSVHVSTGSSGASVAHLEPDVACKIPQY